MLRYSTDREEDRFATQAAVMPAPEMSLDWRRAALVVIDPQVDRLTLGNPALPLWSQDAEQRQAVARNLARLLKVSRRLGMTVAVSLTRPCKGGQGAAFMAKLAPYLEYDETVVSWPRGSSNGRLNDLGFRLRRRRADQILLAGMVDSFPLDSHLRDFLEQGFEVAVVRDAVAGSRLPEGEGHLTALVKFRGLAKALWTTEATIGQLEGRSSWTG